MNNKNKLQPSDYQLFSGGAVGSDHYFEIIGKEFGLTEFNHYWYKKKNPFSKQEDEISEEDYQEGILKIHEVNKILKRKNIEKYMHLLARNWCQVKYSDAVYAISVMKSKTEFSGGTMWAIQMGILTNKPVYVFDQEKEKWYFWNNDKFEYCVTPKLSLYFAGIGTREINDAGIKAIRNVYEKTLL